MAHNLDELTLTKVAEASELVIRAASVLGTLSEAQQRAIHAATQGVVPHSLGGFLRCARALVPDVEQSLRMVPPEGLCDFWY